jgi:beta-lactam-binding protein with PASTA domain
LSLSPAPGGSVATDTDIAIKANPSLEQMHYLMPDLRGKSRTEAKAALGPFGVAASAVDAVTLTLPDSAPNPDVGPDKVVSADPAVGQAVPYGQAPQAVTVNPSTAVDPNTTGGATGSGPYTCGLSAP